MAVPAVPARVPAARLRRAAARPARRVVRAAGSRRRHGSNAYSATPGSARRGRSTSAAAATPASTAGGRVAFLARRRPAAQRHGLRDRRGAARRRAAPRVPRHRPRLRRRCGTRSAWPTCSPATTSHVTIGERIGADGLHGPRLRAGLDHDAAAGRARRMAGAAADPRRAAHERRELARRLRAGRLRGSQRYGLRVHELRRFAELPRLAGGAVRARARHPPGRRRATPRGCAAGGWRWWRPRRSPRRPADTGATCSARDAEMMVAKGMYVHTRSGWLSERSLCYLASGRPVLAQDTGFADCHPAGEGLLAFATPDEALAGVEAIRAEPARHAAAARELAREHFDSDRVLCAAARPCRSRAGVTTVIVSGAVANKHRHGGSAWVRLSWAEAFAPTGLRRPLRRDSSTRACRRRSAARRACRATRRTPPRSRRRWTRPAWPNRRRCSARTVRRVTGLSREELLDRAAGAALLVNLSGHLRDAQLLARAPACARSSTSTPATPRSGSPRATTSAPRATTLHFTVGANVGTRALRAADRRAALAGDPPAGRARALARRRRRGSPASRRSAAGAARTGRSSWAGRTLRRQGPRVPAAGRTCPARDGPAVRGRARHPRRRRSRRATACAPAAGACGRRQSRGDAGRVRALRARLGRGVLGRPGRLRAHAQRLVQRPHRPLPRERPPRARAGHRVRATRCRSARACSTFTHARRTPSRRARELVGRSRPPRRGGAAARRGALRPGAALAPLLDAAGVAP